MDEASFFSGCVGLQIPSPRPTAFPIKTRVEERPS